MRYVQARLLGVTARVLAHCSGEVAAHVFWGHVCFEGGMIERSLGRIINIGTRVSSNIGRVRYIYRSMWMRMKSEATVSDVVKPLHQNAAVERR